MNLIDLNQIDITQASDCNKLSYEHNYDLFDYKGFQIIKVQDRHCLGIIDDQLIFFDRFFSEEGWVKYENQEFPNANLSLEDINLADYYTVILSYPQFLNLNFLEFLIRLNTVILLLKKLNMVMNGAMKPLQGQFL
jgi:hypothetical protein